MDLLINSKVIEYREYGDMSCHCDHALFLWGVRLCFYDLNFLIMDASTWNWCSVFLLSFPFTALKVKRDTHDWFDRYKPAFSEILLQLTNELCIPPQTNILSESLIKHKSFGSESTNNAFTCIFVKEKLWHENSNTVLTCEIILPN